MFRKPYKHYPAPHDQKTPVPPGRRRRGLPAATRARNIWLDFLKPCLASIPSVLYWPFKNITIFSSIAKNRESQSEPQKVMSKRDRWEAAGTSTIHLLPISITVVLMCLNFSQTYMEPVGSKNQNARLSALQFAAKLHEILIVASLSTMVLHCVQYELLYGPGVSLGSLLAGFQVSDLSSLWSPGLRATATAGGKRVRRLAFAFLIIVLVILGAAVGPSSAILMIPSIDWWGFNPNSYGVTLEDARFFLGANSSTIWPNHISITDPFPADCTAANNSVPEYCPLGGFSTLFGLASPTELLNWNFTLPHDYGPGGGEGIRYNRYLEGAYAWSQHSSEGDQRLKWFLTQTTPLIADNLLLSINYLFPIDNALESTRLELLLSNNSQLLAPLTYTVCNSSSYVWGKDSLYRAEVNPAVSGEALVPVEALSELTFPMADSTNWSTPAATLLDVWNDSTRTAALWTESPNFCTKGPSIGIVFPTLQDSDVNFSIPAVSIYTCSIYSGWQPIQLYVNTAVDLDLHSTTIDHPMDVINDQSSLVARMEHYIRIDTEWANSAIPPNATIGELTRKMHLDNDYSDAWVNPFGAAVSILLTYVLARVSVKQRPIRDGKFP